MFKKVLVANRGEIAVRIIQTLREMGITSVAVFSNADRHSLHVLLADEAICIGGPRATDSYLNMRNVVSAAILSGAEAVHPGFGFLSENAEFAKLVTDAGLAFIGPKPTAIEQMGDKAVARQTMIDIGVPVIPGSRPLQDVDTALAAAQAIGYPLMLKASAGGGGKGIRKLASADDLTAEFAGAQAEAQAAFGDPTMYLEKVIVPAKHVEVQVLRDQQGHVSVFPERDCSLQRHSQKMIEESPCPVLTSPERAKLLHLAETIADGVDYLNAGTIEFLMDQQHHFYFMEMNTRIQVEHPITEMVTGVDLVQAQLRIAAGEDVELTTPGPSGVAIECRLNAEDPDHQFMPDVGTLEQLRFPTGGLGLRVDTGVAPGDKISPYYDAMIAKIIVHGQTRQAALAKMHRALTELDVQGVKTNRDFALALFQAPKVLAGEADTAYLNRDFLPQWQDERKDAACSNHN